MVAGADGSFPSHRIISARILLDAHLTTPETEIHLLTRPRIRPRGGIGVAIVAIECTPRSANCSGGLFGVSVPAIDKLKLLAILMKTSACTI